MTFWILFPITYMFTSLISYRRQFYGLKMEMFSVNVVPIENESQKRQGGHDLVFVF